MIVNILSAIPWRLKPKTYIIVLMQSNNPAPVPPSAGGQNPYDFILNDSNKPKRNWSTNSLKQRIFVVAIVGSLVLIAIIVVMSFVSNGNSAGARQLIDIAQQQNEIIRVAKVGLEKAGSTDTINLAATTELSVQSSQADILAILKKSGHKIGSDKLTIYQKSQTDQQLDDAASAGTFDVTFAKILQDSLASYRSALQNAYASESFNNRQLLQNSFNSATAITGTQPAS